MRTMKLTDFIEVNPSVKLSTGKEYPCVMMDEITPGRRYVFGENTKAYKGGARFEKGDVLFARITPCLENGKIAQFMGEGAGFGSTEYFIFREKEGISDQSYIFYLACSDIVRKPAEKSMFGASGRQRADLNVVKEVDIPAPPLDTQRKIAAVLSAYDDLIENNTRRIQILEEMAQAIYRQWFVEFQYPGHESVPLVDSGTDLNEIPQGWEVEAISNVAEVIGGGTPSTKVPEFWDDGDINWFAPRDLTAAGTMFMSESPRKITDLGLQKSSAKMFPAYSVMMTSRATLGVTAINTLPACTNQGFITCVPSERLSNYQIYFWISENLEKIISVASGATFKEITKGTFRKFPIVIAPHEIHTQFVEFVAPICKQIENLQQKNTNLRATRDLLLPRLVSGAVDVSDLPIKE
jgi:type I restriction enzyme, S subunit